MDRVRMFRITTSRRLGRDRENFQDPKGQETYRPAATEVYPRYSSAASRRHVGHTKTTTAKASAAANTNAGDTVDRLSAPNLLGVETVHQVQTRKQLNTL
jgi:hypothetical protein